MPTAQWFAVVATVVLGLVMVFQLLLAAGLPLGAAAWGGKYRVLPPALRWASLAAAFVIAAIAWVVLARAGFVAPGAEPVAIRVATWVFAGFFSLNTLGNLASESRAERYVMTPATVLMVFCLVIISMSPAVAP
jgi:hypothetical protein